MSIRIGIVSRKTERQKERKTERQNGKRPRVRDRVKGGKTAIKQVD